MIADMVREARISSDQQYRYTLLRRWGDTPRKGITWIMLNPSTADAEKDDPTIRRCMKFTERMGFKAMLVVNLFALRATNPRDLLWSADPVGPENGSWVRKACHQGAIVIAAWGALQEPFNGASRNLAQIIQKDGYALKCLGTTKDGSPRHPLYVRANAPLVDWRE